VARLRLFASVRVAAGTGRTDVDGDTVGEVVANACARYGPEFAALVQSCRVWRNGEPTLDGDAVGPDDEVAILPPVSGG
jgi:sulfur-carrier protein